MTDFGRELTQGIIHASVLQPRNKPAHVRLQSRGTRFCRDGDCLLEPGGCSDGVAQEFREHRDRLHEITLVIHARQPCRQARMQSGRPHTPCGQKD